MRRNFTNIILRELSVFPSKKNAQMASYEASYDFETPEVFLLLCASYASDVQPAVRGCDVWGWRLPHQMFDMLANNALLQL